MKCSRRRRGPQAAERNRTMAWAAAVAAQHDSASFVKVAKRELSGQTGQLVTSVAVFFYEGPTWIKDGADRILASLDES
jgi:hypothetical protein